MHDGMNPDNPLLQEYAPVYNMGINLLRIYEALEYLKHCILNSNVKRIVFGLDFFMFNAAEKVNPSYDPRVVGRKITLFDYIYTPLFTNDALMGTWDTILVSHGQSGRNEFLSNGYRPGQFVFYKLKDYRKLHDYTNRVFLSRDPTESPYYGIYKRDDDTFRFFEQFIRICKDKNIDLKLFISPAHANLDGECIRVANLWNDFEDWKRKITDICYKYGVTLWDFSGYNSVTTEKVKTPMEYFWDSSHYTEKTSELILNRLFDNGKSGKKEPVDFGVSLSPPNIERQLEANRTARERYAKSHKNEIDTIQQIYIDAERGLPIPSELTTGIFE